jgi:hypothetical protein
VAKHKEENGRMKRKAKVTGNEEINEVVWEWFRNKRSRHSHILSNDPSESLAVAISIGDDQFKESTGWLDSFKKRHNIVWNGVYGESKEVDESVVNEYKPKLLELISPYEPKNIYNADKTGLFFGELPTKSLAVKGERCPKKELQCYFVGILWVKWKSSKTKMFQEPEN